MTYPTLFHKNCCLVKIIILSDNITYYNIFQNLETILCFPNIIKLSIFSCRTVVPILNFILQKSEKIVYFPKIGSKVYFLIFAKELKAHYEVELQTQ